MEQYLGLLDRVLREGTYKENRTGVDTIAGFSHHYRIDLGAGFPLLTTKDLSGPRWNSLIHELLWYLSGEEHIRNLREETSIWDAWADDEGHLDTAYGRFWRRFPIPSESERLPGEAWPGEEHEFVTDEGTFDQLGHALDQLRENPNSRRIVVSAWHPANAAVSQLPPCHYTFAFTVQDGRLNTHLTQRSADLALGVPFNIGAYSLLTHAVAQAVGLEVGRFGHSLVDAHVYVGEGDRGSWYAENLGEFQDRLEGVETKAGYETVRAWVERESPPEPEKGYDHVPGLLTQLSREPRDRPHIEVAEKPIDDLEFDDFRLEGYEPHPPISFAVAE
ncbi:MAG: thymidylate synthase [Halodesulfurarchaeum sp.]